MAEDHGRVVAVVDDDFRVLQALGSLLEAAGHSVRVFPSAAEFLGYEDIHSVGCLISDVGMPVTDGFELRQLMGTQRPDLPVILISGRIEMDHPRTAPIGNRRFFRKPFDSKELLASVAVALEECQANRSSNPHQP